jgi:hypothetical protein
LSIEHLIFHFSFFIFHFAFEWEMCDTEWEMRKTEWEMCKTEWEMGKGISSPEGINICRLKRGATTISPPLKMLDQS